MSGLGEARGGGGGKGGGGEAKLSDCFNWQHIISRK